MIQWNNLRNICNTKPFAPGKGPIITTTIIVVVITDIFNILLI